MLSSGVSGWRCASLEQASGVPLGVHLLHALVQVDEWAFLAPSRGCGLAWDGVPSRLDYSRSRQAADLRGRMAVSSRVNRFLSANGGCFPEGVE